MIYFRNLRRLAAASAMSLCGIAASASSMAAELADYATVKKWIGDTVVLAPKGDGVRIRDAMGTESNVIAKFGVNDEDRPYVIAYRQPIEASDGSKWYKVAYVVCQQEEFCLESAEGLSQETGELFVSESFAAECKRSKESSESVMDKAIDERFGILDLNGWSADLIPPFKLAEELVIEEYGETTKVPAGTPLIMFGMKYTRSDSNDMVGSVMYHVGGTMYQRLGGIKLKDLAQKNFSEGKAEVLSWINKN